MNLDIAIINSLVYPDKTMSDAEKLRWFDVSGHRCENKHQEIVRFMKRHFLQHKKLPGPKLLKSKFRNFTFEKQEEDLAFYLSESSKMGKMNVLKDVAGQIELYLVDDDVDKAVTYLLDSASKINRSQIVTRDINIKDAINVWATNYKDKRDNGGDPGILLGIKKLDQETYGVQPGEFWIWCSRPANYKTWMLCHFFHNIVQDYDAPFLFFSKEMTPFQIQSRLHAISGGVAYTDLRRHKLKDAQIQRVVKGVKQLRGQPVIIGKGDYTEYNASYIKSKILEYKCPLAVVDGMYMLGSTVDWKDQSQAVAEMREVPLDCEMGVIATSQLNRTGGKNAGLDNLAYADAYGMFASVIFSQARRIDETRNKPTRTLQMTSIKNREEDSHNVTTIRLGFKKSEIAEGIGPDLDGDEWMDDIAEQQIVNFGNGRG